MNNYNYPVWVNPYAYNQQMTAVQNNQMPYQQQQTQVMPNAPVQGTYQTNVRMVDGIEGVKSAPMAPNSSELFVDKTAPLIWYARTDGAGFKTEILPYPVTNDAQKAENDQMKEVYERLERLEAQANAKSDNASNRSKKSE